MGQAAQAPRVRLAFIEEAMAETAAAVVGQQHRLAAVEDPIRGHGQRREWLADGRHLVDERNAGRGADHARAIEREHEHAARRARIGGQVFAFVGGITGVEVGPVPEHGDAQRGHRIEMRLHRAAHERAQLDHVAPPALACAAWAAAAAPASRPLAKQAVSR